MEHECNKEADIEVIKTTVINLDKRINGSIDDIEKHISSGKGWRVGIVGVAVMIIIQTITLASMWGRLCRTVEVNTVRIFDLEVLHPRTVK